MTRWIPLVLAVCAASTASAQSKAGSQSYSREGFSIGGSVALALEDFDEDGSFDDSSVLGLVAGYRVAPNVAIDARLEQTDEFDGDFGPFDVEVEVTTLSANMQFFFATEQFQPYALVGLGIGEAEVDVDPGGSDDETDLFLRGGLGIDTYASPHFVIGAEATYNYGIDDFDDFNYWGLGVIFRYRF